MNLSSILELLNNRAQAVAVVDANGDQITDFSSTVTFPDPPSTAALTNVTSSASSVAILAANANRRQFLIYNDSSKTLRVAFGVTASATAFSILIPSKGSYESPMNGFTGDLNGIWDSANGFARVTEVTV